jgi:hypothetical protein
MLKKEYYICFLLGLLGTLAGNFILNPTSLSAAGAKRTITDYLGISSRSSSKRRIELATYDGSYSKSEADLPLVALYDRADKLRLLFRLAGKNESPALILKDSNGIDRMVIGLSLNAKSEEPYIYFYDRSGKQKNVAWNLLTD